MNPSYQNRVVDITVVECLRLKDTEWFTKQDPYVSFQYGSARFRTRTCSSGGTAPVFLANFTLPLIEGLREIDVGVWNRHRLSKDNLIGSGKIQLQNVLSGGYDDRCWTILTRSGRYAGEVKLIMRYSQPAADIPPPPPTTAYPPPPFGPSTTAYPPPNGHPNAAYPPPNGHPNAAYPPPPAPSAPPPPPHHHGDPQGQGNRMYPGPPY